MNKQIRNQEELKQLVKSAMYKSMCDKKPLSNDPISVEGLFKIWDKNKKKNHHHISVNDKLIDSGLFIGNILKNHDIGIVEFELDLFYDNNYNEDVILFTIWVNSGEFNLDVKIGLYLDQDDINRDCKKFRTKIVGVSIDWVDGDVDMDEKYI